VPVLELVDLDVNWREMTPSAFLVGANAVPHLKKVNRKSNGENEVKTGDGLGVGNSELLQNGAKAVTLAEGHGERC
jgi:hypothetical protein